MNDETKISEKVLLIRINQNFKEGMSPLHLFESTRGIWRIGKKREKVDFAFAVYKGIIKEVFVVKNWYPAGSLEYKIRTEIYDLIKKDKKFKKRWEFDGEVAEEEMRNKYIGNSVKHYFVKGNSNPIKYVNV